MPHDNVMHLLKRKTAVLTSTVSTKFLSALSRSVSVGADLCVCPHSGEHIGSPLHKPRIYMGGLCLQHSRRLHVVQIGVDAIQLDQLVMRPLLIDAVVGQDDDPVRVADG
jgi:hypothetical protein